MADDWKLIVDKYWEKQALSGNVRKDAETEQAGKDVQAAQDRLRRELKEKQERLARQFWCNICKKPAHLPNQVSFDIEGETQCCADDWTKPGDLWECIKCGQWNCREHIHLGICENCTGKLTI